ncbi:Enhancer of split mgamma protein [Frankliniella fusca]|uniref:Enhancer of split mgamma protein n=1 Tax=Frankliniella fusca TaxID=407009 RepID=A0AAE1H190_9NEOP|nr:Enhancer of split mgamma protein [Frankliniella fusca]
MLMASLRDPYAAAAAAGVGMLAASQLAQLNQLMMQQQQQQHAHQLQLQHQQQLQQPHSPSQAAGPLPLGAASLGPPLGPPLGSPPECQSPPISRTYTYKKVTKPLLERKRRARINRCLDELKELMVGALEAEGENVSKLEKADILELTVRHLQRITKPRDIAEDASRFQAGFSQCASEACHFLLGLPGLDAAVGRRLVAHLGQVVNQVGLGAAASPGMAPRPASTTSTTTTYSPPASPDQHHGQPEADVLQHMARQQHLQLQQGAMQGPMRSQLHAAGDAEGEVSSTSRGGIKRPGSRHGRSDLDDDSEDDDEDHDSDAPVNYTSEALHRQHRKRPRFDFPAGASASTGATACGGKGWVSSSKESQGSQSGSEDEDKGPMWRPW